MRVEYSDDADADLSDLGEYIAQDDPVRATGFVREFYAFIDRVSEKPLAYRIRYEWGSRVRASRYGNYLVIFEIEDDHLLVLRIVNGRRDIAKLLGERLK